MREVRGRRMATASWIPLRAYGESEQVGTPGVAGFRWEISAVGTLAVAVADMREADALGWADVGISHSHYPHVDGGRYVASDIYEPNGRDPLGTHLVLEQRGNGLDPKVWHLHQDLLLALRLKREDNVWVSMEEGYRDVARLRLSIDGSPARLEIRGEDLRDYLCARQMALYVTSYRQREAVVEDASHVSWPDGRLEEVTEGAHWKGQVVAIHEGGQPFGSKTAVFHARRTDVDREEDVPVLGPPSSGAVESTSRTIEHVGRRVFQISGRFWLNEWVPPADLSPRVRRDPTPPTVFFISDAAGTTESRDTLVRAGRWLWFRPDVINALTHRRGGELGWYTRDTGSVACSPGDDVHFGVNRLGLVTVFAKDIALLPDWEQKVWAAFNVTPEGGVSDELLASQVESEPASTRAPEAFLGKSLADLTRIGHEKFGVSLLRPHPEVPEIVARCHRFRAVERGGLFALAKDLARITADNLDVSVLRKLLPMPRDGSDRSLKLLEKLVATKVGEPTARSIVGPLVGIYELRLADAHLAREDLADSFALAGVHQDDNSVRQGFQLVHSCVTSIVRVAVALAASRGTD
jgi:hypothetical protein